MIIWALISCRRLLPLEVMREKVTESSFTVFQIIGRAFIWLKLTKALNDDCLFSTVKKGGNFVMIWALIFCRRLLPLDVMRKKVTGEKYHTIFADPLHPMFQKLFPGECPLF